jgi:hydrogenase maturation protease
VRASNSVMIIGIGNPERGDDRAGREVARRLKLSRFAKAQVLETEGEATTLLALMEKSAVVFLIDACVSGAPPGTIRRVDLTRSILPEARYGVSSHGFGLAEAVSLASSLGTLPRRCVLYAIEGRNFDVGAPVSPTVSAAVDDVVSSLIEELDAHYQNRHQTCSSA